MVVAWRGIFVELMGSRGVFDLLLTHGKENCVYCPYTNLLAHLCITWVHFPKLTNLCLICTRLVFLGFGVLW